MIVAFHETYDTRKSEIEKFIQLMKFFESKHNSIIEEENEFDQFFYSQNGSIDLSYQELINILKSNVCLMLYNIIEYTVTNLIESIYDEIRLRQLSYIQINESIRKIWRKVELKAMEDPNSNSNTFLKKNEKMIKAILDDSIIDICAKNALPAGNLDGNGIRDTFMAHGISLSTNSGNFRPEILDKIKNNRNNLAHGSVSFVEALRDDSTKDIEINKNIVIGFLTELIDIVLKYIEEEKFINTT